MRSPWPTAGRTRLIATKFERDKSKISRVDVCSPAIICLLLSVAFAVHSIEMKNNKNLPINRQSDGRQILERCKQFLYDANRTTLATRSAHLMTWMQNNLMSRNKFYPLEECLKLGR